jgi:acetyl esterase/lipase
VIREPKGTLSRSYLRGQAAIGGAPYEGERYAERLREAGVRTALLRYDGMNKPCFRFSEVVPRRIPA